MVCCIDCAHCAKMLHWKNDYLCTFGGEVNWMYGKDVIMEGECDLFVKPGDYLEQMDCNNTEE